MLPSTIKSNQLEECISKPRLIILDASMQASDSIIPGAVFMDLKGRFADANSPYPNTLPSIERLYEQCNALGLSQNSQIVVYDNKGIHSAPRAWFILSMLGYNVSVLDGGLPAWIDQGISVSTEYAQPERCIESEMQSTLEKHLVSYEDILRHSNSAEYRLIDVRSAGRYKGVEPEPRAHIQSGSIPNSANIPYTKLLSNGHYKSKEALKEIFADIKAEDGLVFSCGSGVTACIAYLAASMVLDNDMAIYDGSWTEWAMKQELYT